MNEGRGNDAFSDGREEAACHETPALSLKASTTQARAREFRFELILQILSRGLQCAHRRTQWCERVQCLMASGDRHDAAACSRAAKEPIGLRGSPDHTAESASDKASPRRCRSAPSIHTHNANPAGVRAAPARRFESVWKCWGVSALHQSIYVEFVAQVGLSFDLKRGDVILCSKPVAKPDVRKTTHDRPKLRSRRDPESRMAALPRS